MSDYIDFEPMTDQQIDEMYLLPDGKYRAEVEEAEDKDTNGQFLLTHSGVRKFDATLRVYDHDGKSKKVKCSLSPAYMKLFKHFFVATDQLDAYDAKKINISNVRGKKDFVVDIGRQSYVSKKTGKNVTVNNVLDFLPQGSSTSGSDSQFFDDPIPF